MAREASYCEYGTQFWGKKFYFQNIFLTMCKCHGGSQFEGLKQRDLRNGTPLDICHEYNDSDCLQFICGKENYKMENNSSST